MPEVGEDDGQFVAHERVRDARQQWRAGGFQHHVMERRSEAAQRPVNRKSVQCSKSQKTAEASQDSEAATIGIGE